MPLNMLSTSISATIEFEERQIRESIADVSEAMAYWVTTTMSQIPATENLPKKTQSANKWPRPQFPQPLAVAVVEEEGGVRAGSTHTTISLNVWAEPMTSQMTLLVNKNRLIIYGGVPSCFFFCS